MKVIRKYYDSLDILMRSDLIEVRFTFPPDLRASLLATIWPRTIQTEIFEHGMVYSVHLEGDYTSYDDAGPPYNYNWVKKILGNGQNVIIDMSDLPKIGDDIIISGFGFGHGPFGHQPFGGS
jgi:hypothetical protein